MWSSSLALFCDFLLTQLCWIIFDIFGGLCLSRHAEMVCLLWIRINSAMSRGIGLRFHENIGEELTVSSPKGTIYSSGQNRLSAFVPWFLSCQETRNEVQETECTGITMLSNIAPHDVPPLISGSQESSQSAAPLKPVFELNLPLLLTLGFHRCRGVLSQVPCQLNLLTQYL